MRHVFVLIELCILLNKRLKHLDFHESQNFHHTKQKLIRQPPRRMSAIFVSQYPVLPSGKGSQPL
jgi:hypothetical protein